MLSSNPPSLPPPPSLQPLPSSVVGQSTRIDLGEIKSKITKRIGQERAKKYFQHLQRFLSSKLSKIEFDKLCLTTVGHENIPLHNHLIRSILHNACQASGPPTINAPNLIGDATNSTHALIPLVWDNGDVSHQHVKDHHPPSRREDAFTQQSSLNHGETTIRSNGAPHLSDLKRLTQRQQSEFAEPLAKRSRVEKVSLNVQDSPHSNGRAAVDVRENWEEIVQHAQDLVHAPLGIRFYPASFSRTKKLSTLTSVAGSDSTVNCYELGELFDTSSLRKQMEKIADAEGLEGVSVECANLLNNGIDVFLRQLIRSCVELVGARSEHDKLSHMAAKQQLNRKLINGLWLQNHVHVQNGSTPRETNSISMEDFKAASELNPQFLGVNASLLLEKINSYC